MSLGPSHRPLLTPLWLLHARMIKVSGCDRDHMACTFGHPCSLSSPSPWPSLDPYVITELCHRLALPSSSPAVTSLMFQALQDPPHEAGSHPVILHHCSGRVCLTPLQPRLLPQRCPIHPQAQPYQSHSGVHTPRMQGTRLSFISCPGSGAAPSFTCPPARPEHTP